MSKEKFKVPIEILTIFLEDEESLIYDSVNYKLIDKQRTPPEQCDGEWYDYIMQRETDKKLFKWSYGIGDTRDYYENVFEEVKAIIENVKKVKYE